MTEPANILYELAATAHRRAEQLRRSSELDLLYQQAVNFKKRPFEEALRLPGLSVISEIKRASPSAGFIREVDPAEWGARYEAEGARCLSVLTEPSRFRGSLLDLQSVRENTGLPVLRKDFTVDEAQILDTGMFADAVLLIAALLGPKELTRYVSLAFEVGLAPLVEVHDEWEAELALETGTRIVGVNNRNLKSFRVDLATTEKLASRLRGVTLVAESGVNSVADARRLRDAGADAILVGEAAMRDPSLVSKISRLRW